MTRNRAAERTTGAFSRRYPDVPQLSLPFIEVVEPRSIVHALADYFDIPALLAQ